MTAALRSAFARRGFVELTALIPAALRARIAGEATAALDAFSVRRDVCVPATGMSPRTYRVTPRDAIAAACPAAAAYYRSPELLALLAQVAGEPLAPVPYVPEEFIATRLERAGDTHGWHWDDYAFALVWVVCAPEPAAGAALEFVAGVPWHKDAPRVEAILAARPPSRVHLGAGTVYLLRADTSLHRVAPLVRDERRDALCFSYANVRDLTREVTHDETLDYIFMPDMALMAEALGMLPQA
jgi:hypothetical protein